MVHNSVCPSRFADLGGDASGMSSYAGFCPVQVYLKSSSMSPLCVRWLGSMWSWVEVRMDSSYSLTEHVRPEDGVEPVH